MSMPRNKPAHSVLDEDKVRWIRSVEGDMSIRDMSNILKCGHTTIHKVLRRETWRDVV